MFLTQILGGKPQAMPMNGAATSTTAPATGNAMPKNSLNTSFQVISAAAATVIIEVTNERASAEGTNNNWITLATVTLAGPGTDGFTSNAPWGWVRARTTVATTATQVLMGV